MDALTEEGASETGGGEEGKKVDVFKVVCDLLSSERYDAPSRFCKPSARQRAAEGVEAGELAGQLLKDLCAAVRCVLWRKTVFTAPCGHRILEGGKEGPKVIGTLKALLLAFFPPEFAHSVMSDRAEGTWSPKNKALLESAIRTVCSGLGGGAGGR